MYYTIFIRNLYATKCLAATPNNTACATSFSAFNTSMLYQRNFAFILFHRHRIVPGLPHPYQPPLCPSNISALYISLTPAGPKTASRPSFPDAR